MKPLELVDRAISNSSKPNELVLDLFGGSGSTLISADQLKRTAYIIELDEKFVYVIIKRFIRHNENINDEYYRIREGKKTLIKDIEEYFN